VQLCQEYSDIDSEYRCKAQKYFIPTGYKLAAFFIPNLRGMGYYGYLDKFYMCFSKE